MTTESPPSFETDLVESVESVWSQIGYLHIESVYRRALAAELASRGYSVVEEHPVLCAYKTSKGDVVCVGKLSIDLVVHSSDKTHVVELKHLNPTLAARENTEIQLRGYFDLLCGPMNPEARGCAAMVFFPKTAAGKLSTYVL